MDVKEYLKGEFFYDEHGQQIYLKKEDGTIQLIADVRGWGAIQNLHQNNKGQIGFASAIIFQDEVGKWIAKSLNKNK